MMENTDILRVPLNQICVNPFVVKLKFTKCDRLRMFTIGLVLLVLRTILITMFVLLAGGLAKIFCMILWILKIKRKTDTFHKWSNRFKVPVFFLMRCAFFCAGIHWITVTDKRGNNLKPTIIPCAPHSSFFDVVLLIKLGIPSIVSRYENSKYCLIGNMLTLCDPVYVKRDNKESRIKAADDIKERARIGTVMIFPEGTCANRTALLQFKTGAFLPNMPVQPVVIKWKVGRLDTITWTEEGINLKQIFFYTLCKFNTNCEIIKLPPYTPSEDEVADTRLFADNVSKLMCDELKIMQSFYSYDEVMFIGFANEIRIFRSPTCIKLLKVCYKVMKEKCNQENTVSNISKPIKKPKLAPLFNPRYLGFGEDFEHNDRIPSFYIPKEFDKFFQKKKEKIKSKYDDVKKLPLSGVLRNKRDSKQPIPQIAVTSELADEKRLLYETFCEIVENALNNIENKAELIPIESSEHLAILLGIEKYATIRESASIVDLLKALEYTTPNGPNTLHLLIVLHLCDCREPNLWERIRTTMILLSAYQNISSPQDGNTTVGDTDGDINPITNATEMRAIESASPDTSLNLMQFKTLMWYLLGLQQFNDISFRKKIINFDFVRKNLKNVFRRAVEENACLLD